MMGGRLYITGALLLAALIAGCTFKSVYNRLDDLIPQYVEGVISLDATHEELLEQRTTILLQWHRNTQLKQYVSWLQALHQDVGQSLTEARLCLLYTSDAADESSSV